MSTTKIQMKKPGAKNVDAFVNALETKPATVETRDIVRAPEVARQQLNISASVEIVTELKVRAIRERRKISELAEEALAAYLRS